MKLLLAIASPTEIFHGPNHVATDKLLMMSLLRHAHFSMYTKHRITTSNGLIGMVAARPRLLYSAAFAWLAVTGGRFLAPFLEHEADYSDSLVGTVLAAQYAVYSILGSVGGSWADSRERQYPNRGRAQVMFAGVVLGSTSFVLHGMCHVVPSVSLFSSNVFHFVLRMLWACALSLVMPVIDGMTLAHLEKAVEMDPSDYGKERLYGTTILLQMRLVP